MPATIKKGSSGPAVSQWQELLTAAGHPVDVTGTFDEATHDATVAWQSSGGLAADGVVGPKSWEAMTGEPSHAYNPSYATKADFGRQVLANVWPEILAMAAEHERPEVRELAALGPPNLATLQITQANAQLESGYGLFQYMNKVTGEKSGVINNWGAVQGGKPPCDPAKAFEASDTHADGTPYTHCYKKYPTPEAGAVDMVREMTIRRPTSWANMVAGDIDAWAASMRSKDPITGVFGYFEQAADKRAKGIEERTWAIADALGEPVAATRGGPSPDPDGTGGGVDPGTPPDPEDPGGPGGGLGVAAGVFGIGLPLLALGAGGAYVLWARPAWAAPVVVPVLRASGWVVRSSQKLIGRFIR